MSLSLLEVLANGARLVLASDDLYFVTWNRSVTFQIWAPDDNGWIEECEIRTYGGESTMTLADAVPYAARFLVEWRSEEG